MLFALLLICASHAQDSVTLSGVEAMREGDSAIIELNTSGNADFRLDRFTMGNWVTVWSSRLALGHGDEEEHELTLDCSGFQDLITHATSVAGRHHGELRFYLGDNVDTSAITIRREGEMTVLVIPAAGADSPAAGRSLQEPFPSGNSSGGSFFIPRDEEQAAAEADTAGDESPTAVLGVSSDFGSDGSEQDQLDDIISGIEIPVAGDHSSEADEDSSARSGGSGVAPGRFKSGEPVEFVRKEEKKQGIVVPPADDSNASIMPGIDSSSSQDSLSGEARINVQRNLQGQPADGDDNVDKLLDDMKNGSSQSAPEAGPSGGRGGLSTPRRDVDPYQNPASINLGGMMNGRKVGKAALEDLAIELFQIVDTPLDQAFTLLFQQTDYNVIVDASVGAENNVSLSFKDGTTNLRDALDLMTRAYGLEYVVNANTVVIASKEKMYSGLIDFETRVFVLSYADPKNVKDILINTGVVGEKQVEAYVGENEFLTQGGGDTTLSNDSESAITAKPIATNISTTPRNAVVVKGTPEEIEYVGRLIKEIDRKPKRVELEVKVCEANESALKNLGLQFNDFGNGSGVAQLWTEQFDDIDYFLNPQGQVEETVQKFQDFSIGSFDRNGLSFQATLNLQLQNGNVESLAQPTLNTVDGKQAIYFAGERIPYISSVTQEQGAITQEISFLPVGVTLNFKPRLDADDLITIDVNPIISSLTEFRQIGGVEAPRTSSRQLATTVRVMDGQPFVMAGLITNTERETIDKIPLLGDFPLVGKLFRNKRKDGQRTEIIIVVTPHIYD
ncbi:type II secretion system protein GspD [bacterium]|nr:type II secretion system protein GspD [bacterium]